MAADVQVRLILKPERDGDHIIVRVYVFPGRDDDYVGRFRLRIGEWLLWAEGIREIEVTETRP